MEQLEFAQNQVTNEVLQQEVRELELMVGLLLLHGGGSVNVHELAMSSNRPRFQFALQTGQVKPSFRLIGDEGDKQWFLELGKTENGAYGVVGNMSEFRRPKIFVDFELEASRVEDALKNDDKAANDIAQQ